MTEPGEMKPEAEEGRAPEPAPVPQEKAGPAGPAGPVVPDRIHFCPDCSNIIAEGTEECPRCGFRRRPLEAKEGPWVPLEERWYYSRDFVKKLLFYSGPLGLPFLWKSPHFDESERARYTTFTVAATIVIVIWIGVMLWFFLPAVLHILGL